MLNQVFFGASYSNVMVTEQLIIFSCEHVRKDDKIYTIALDDMIEKKSNCNNSEFQYTYLFLLF